MDAVLADFTVALASMGPRSNDRGNETDITATIATMVALQWGRDQMIAEMT